MILRVLAAVVALILAATALAVFALTEGGGGTPDCSAARPCPQVMPNPPQDGF